MIINISRVVFWCEITSLCKGWLCLVQVLYKAEISQYFHNWNLTNQKASYSRVCVKINVFSINLKLQVLEQIFLFNIITWFINLVGKLLNATVKKTLVIQISMKILSIPIYSRNLMQRENRKLGEHENTTNPFVLMRLLHSDHFCGSTWCSLCYRRVNFYLLAFIRYHRVQDSCRSTFLQLPHIQDFCWQNIQGHHGRRCEEGLMGWCRDQ